MDRSAAVSLTLMTHDMYASSGLSPNGIFDRPKDLAALAKYGYDVYGFDCCEIFNIWSHTEFLGVKVDYGDGTKQPQVRGTPFNINSEMADPDLDAYMKYSKTRTTVEGVKALRALAGNDVAVKCISSWGPLTTAGHLVGTEELMYSFATDPDDAKKIIKYVADFNAEAYKIELEQGGLECLDFMSVAEPSASGDLISPKMFQEFAMPYDMKEHKTMRSMGMKTMLHICGNTTANLPFMIKCGSNAISVEQTVDPYEIVKVADDKVAMLGNIGPIKPLWQGTPEMVIKDAERCIDAGFRMIAPGCSFVPMTPKENILAMTNTIRSTKRKFESV